MKLWQHYNNKKLYFVVDWNASIQVNDQWVDAVIYVNSESDKKFIRPISEFLHKFTETNVG